MGSEDLLHLEYIAAGYDDDYYEQLLLEEEEYYQYLAALSEQKTQNHIIYGTGDIPDIEMQRNCYQRRYKLPF